MDERRLGSRGPRVPELGICPGEGPLRQAVVERALALGGRLFWSSTPVPGALTLPSLGGFGTVPYNLRDQKPANAEIARLAKAGEGVVAVHVLAGGALASAPPGLQSLARDGRTFVQAAIQFVLANDKVSCAIVRLTDPAHVEEVLAAPDAPPLKGSELELIFETWANRFDG